MKVCMKANANRGSTAYGFQRKVNDEVEAALTVPTDGGQYPDITTFYVATSTLFSVGAVTWDVQNRVHVVFPRR